MNKKAKKGVLNKIVEETPEETIQNEVVESESMIIDEALLTPAPEEVEEVVEEPVLEDEIEEVVEEPVVEEVVEEPVLEEVVEEPVLEEVVFENEPIEIEIHVPRTIESLSSSEYRRFRTSGRMPK